MDESEQNEWVIKEDEAALEEKVLQKHHAVVKVEEIESAEESTLEQKPDNKAEKKLDDTKEEDIVVYPPAISHRQRKSIASRANDVTSYIGEEISLLVMLMIVPYFIGAVLLFLLVPLWTGINIGALFKATDLSDWSIHFLFWSAGYLALSFLGISVLLGKRGS